MASVVEIVIKTIDQSKGGVSNLTGELGKLAAKYLSVAAVATTAYKVIDESIKTTLDYASSVRELAAASGQSTEASSRFIQVLDDYGMTAQDALQATRFLTKNGYEPSIDTLAKLSDKYLSLNSAQERNDFLLKNLGRSGLQWAEVLKQGGEALKQQGEAVNQSLILNQKSVDAARKYELALDDWNDAIMGVKVAIGNGLLPILTDLLTSTMDNARATEIMAESEAKLSTFQKAFTKDGRDAWNAALDQAQAEREAANATKMHSGAIVDAVPEYKTYADVLRDTISAHSDANNGLLGLIGTMQGSQDSYAANVAAVNADMNLSDDERKAKLGELAAEHDRVTKQIVLDLMTQKFTADGILTDDELNWLLEKGQAWGIYSADVVADAKTAIEWANGVSDAISKIPEEKTITIKVQQLGGFEIGTPGYEHIAHPGRAAGGPVTAGSPYWVGERGKPELFVPNQNGMVMTQAQVQGQGGGVDGVALAAAITSRMPTDKGIARALAKELDMRGIGRR